MPRSGALHGPAQKCQGGPSNHHYTDYSLPDLRRSRCVDALVDMPRWQLVGSGGRGVEAVAEP